ncbi:MAG: hypothetical protein QN152_01070 [Armatimonadota bacterium]|nr:hypothetical protein [Armatimonadota bacterium]MDR7426583.1 hypothetical protein [Armatimonadota bacterium]MDR7463682.1 hypothetical protein [Armatimonadota bacterium]MDR7468603.1 hypothetical protein [Armatimonadota bacterium]MDR7473726.1 hypothetical protein [Armatimonadota bacterium]
MPTLEVVTPTLTYFFHCAHCETALSVAGVGQVVHDQEINEYPEDLKEQYLQLCDWIRALAARHAGRLRVRIVDAYSPRGLWMALRHRARTFPLFVLDGRRIAAGADLASVAALLRERFVPQAGEPHAGAPPEVKNA